MADNLLERRRILSDNAILAYLAVVKFSMHFFTNLAGGYGLFRDEFYYLACADHLAFGYVDQPPLSILLLYLNRLVFGDSLLAVRLLPAVAGALVVYLTGLIIREMGGRLFAQVLGAVAMIAVPFYMGSDNFFSMNAFDQLFWVLIFYLVVRFLNDGNPKLWIWFGIIAGLGLQNKISILFLIFGIAVALLLTRHRKQLIGKHFLAAGLLALILFLPHVVWQIKEGWPTLEFISNAKNFKIADFTPLGFFTEQIMMLNPLLFPLWMAGLVYLLFSRRVAKYRSLAFVYLIVFAAFVVQRSKPYYLTPAYPVLFASGAILCESFTSRARLSWLKSVILIVVVLAGVQSAPFALPVLPVETFIEYASFFGIEPGTDERHEIGKLPQHYADMHGWENMVATVARVYHTLPESEKAVAAILVNNYGEAGAIDYYREEYDLPRAVCGHNSYWHWGYGEASGEVIVRLGGSKEDLEEAYNSVEAAGVVECKYCMPYENNLSVFICRGLRYPLGEVWPMVRHYN